MRDRLTSANVQLSSSSSLCLESRPWSCERRFVQARARPREWTFMSILPDADRVWVLALHGRRCVRFVYARENASHHTSSATRDAAPMRLCGWSDSLRKGN